MSVTITMRDFMAHDEVVVPTEPSERGQRHYPDRTGSRPIVVALGAGKRRSSDDPAIRYGAAAFLVDVLGDHVDDCQFAVVFMVELLRRQDLCLQVARPKARFCVGV